MFTGLVEGQGTVAELLQEEVGVRLEIAVSEEMASPAPELGDSIAINGCCLTVVDVQSNRWAFQAGSETLSRTNLGRLQVGHPVNLEQSLTADAKLGGHFVQGHVDGVGTVSAIDREGEWIHMRFQVPTELTFQMVSKGSIAVDGVSLTLVDVTDDEFSVALIPHTLEVTTLGVRQVGDAVNIETDILGKYLHKFFTNLEQAPAELFRRITQADASQ